MKMKLSKIVIKIGLALTVVLTLFACNLKTGKVIDEANEKMRNEISPLSNNQTFLNGLYLIRNPITRTEMIVKGNGTVLLKTMDPHIERLNIVSDINEDETNFIYKVYEGEHIVTSTYSVAENADIYTSNDASVRCVFYDKNGEEIGLEVNSYIFAFSASDKIIFCEYNTPYYEASRYKVFDVNTKELTNINYEVANYYAGKIVLSTNPYDNNEKEEIIICDKNLDEIKIIEGYSLSETINEDGIEALVIWKNVNDDRKINFVDSDCNIILDNDVDEMIDSSNMPAVKLRVGDKAFEYNLQTKEQLGEEKNYIKEESVWDILQKRKDEYETNRLKIKAEGKGYRYIYTIVLKGQVYYLAYKTGNDDAFDTSPCDIYNTEFEKVLEVDDLTGYYETQGYLFINNDTILDSNLEEIYKFDTKCNIELNEVSGETFFINNTDKDYNTVKKFTLFDANFKPVYNNLYSIEFYTYDNCIIFVDEENTKIIGRDLNIIKTIDRKIDIKSWFKNTTNEYRLFIDITTGRMGIIDKDFNILVDNIKNIIELKENYFNYQNGFSYGIMDYQGRQILTYSIFDTMREDAEEKDFDGDIFDEENLQ